MRNHFFVIFLLCACFFSKANNNIYFYHVGLQNGLSQINIMSIYQDEFGTIWFGTTEGINRYNGKNIQTLASYAFNQRTIYSITGNKNGKIYYIGDRDLYRINLRTQQFEMLLQSNVRSIFYQQDKLWVLTSNSLLVFDENEEKFEKILDLDWKNYSSVYVTESDIWIGSHDGGLFSFSLNNLSDKKQWTNNPIFCIYEDSKNNVWIGTHNNGVYRIDAQYKEMQNFNSSQLDNSISNNQVRCILEDNIGNIWVGTFYGLNCYSPNTNRWEAYTHSEYISHSISHSSIFALTQDKQGTIWVGTYFGGVNYFNIEQNIFQYYEASSIDQEYLSFPYIGKMTEDNSDNLWICTEGGGLNCMNLKTRKISRYLSDDKNYSNQKCIWYDEKNDRLYIGTFNGGLLVFDVNTKKSRRLFHNPNDPESLPHNTINQIQYIEKENALYLSTSKGIVVMDLKTEKIKRFDNPKIKDYMANLFHVDENNNIWLYHSCVMKINLETAERIEYTTKIKADINDIFENEKGDIFFATGGAGIFWYDKSSDSVKQFNTNNGLLSNYCYAIAENDKEYLLVLHNKGFSYFDYNHPENLLYHSSHNFPIQGFNKGNGIYISKEKEIFLGGINGLVSFFEEDLSKKVKNFDIYFDKLFVNSKHIIPTDKSKILNKSLQYYTEIKLKANQNNFSIEFASSNYLQNVTTQYEYRLDGFEKEWTRTNTQTASYTNIDPGNYILQVRQAAPGAKNSNPIYEMKIKIDPPFYLSTIAIILYILLVLAFIFALVRFIIWRTKLKSNLEFERKENERIQELNQTKLRFFTNISHEFRTPLTLISGQVESLLTDQTDAKVKKRAKQIRKNAEHLKNLITELLDFRKQEQGFVKLNVKQFDYKEFVKSIYDSFAELAKKRKISFKLDFQSEEIMIFADPVQLQKVFYNLLANAFKYTEEGEEIRIRATKNNKNVETKIIDNGIGIPAEALNKVFDRFYQIEYRPSGQTLGTGIGLALTKEIVTAHKGEIYAESVLNEGTTFTFTLLLGSAHFSNEELFAKEFAPVILPDGNSFTETNDKDDFEVDLKEQIVPSGEKPLVLLVDDNEELLDLLHESFSPLYNVIMATNGEDALKMAIEEQPDIIVSDVMMHKMSGKELCYKIKNNINTSHIPVVLLTSQTGEEQIVEGFMYGADAYITKPFSMKVLISQCNTLLKNRKLLFEKQHKQSVNSSITEYTSESDKLLFDKMDKIIRANFSNPDFDMNTLSSELGFSRSKFYAKIKSLTGFTPNEYTLNIKMKEAVYLLENKPDMNISEIAFHLGFSSAKYFTKIFKTIYGVVPKEWKREK